jgi:2OG-Fe(II) oxygenase superfamily
VVRQEAYWRTDNIGTIARFFSADECDEYVRLGEATGFEGAPITTSRGMIMMKDVRNNDRVMIDDPERALALYRRLSQHLAPRFQNKWTPVGLNERLRLYRYDVGQQFDWHRDGYFERPNRERSCFTFMVYLNDDFNCGATSFSDDGAGFATGSVIRITPAKGMALLFHHPIVHRGDPVVAGRKKYVLRTDVMYRPAATASRTATLSA